MKRRKLSSPDAEIVQTYHHITPDITSYSRQNVLWPKKDVLTLLQRIHSLLPQSGWFQYQTTLKHINWSSVAFDSYTAEECEQICNVILRKTRKFRLLSELLNDAKAWLDTSGDKLNINSVLTFESNTRVNRFWYFFKEKYEDFKEKHSELDDHHAEFELFKQFCDLPAGEQRKFSGHKEETTFPAQTTKNDEPPAPPRTPIAIFRSCNPSLKPKHWEALPDTQKCFYIRWSELETRVYKEKTEEFINAHPDYNAQRNFRGPRQSDLNLLDTVLGKPSVPPRGPSALFTSILKEIIPPESGEFGSPELYKLLGPAEKRLFQIGVDALWTEYERKFDRYLTHFPHEERLELKLGKGKFLTRPPKRAKVLEPAKKRKKAKAKLVHRPVEPAGSFEEFVRRKGANKVSIVEKDRLKREYEDECCEYSHNLSLWLDSLTDAEKTRFGFDLKLASSDISDSEDEK